MQWVLPTFDLLPFQMKASVATPPGIRPRRTCNECGGSFDLEYGFRIDSVRRCDRGYQRLIGFFQPSIFLFSRIALMLFAADTSRTASRHTRMPPIRFIMSTSPFAATRVIPKRAGCPRSSGKAGSNFGKKNRSTMHKLGDDELIFQSLMQQNKLAGSRVRRAPGALAGRASPGRDQGRQDGNPGAPLISAVLSNKKRAGMDTLGPPSCAAHPAE
jgi:hypothetical protein